MNWLQKFIWDVFGPIFVIVGVVVAVLVIVAIIVYFATRNK